MKKKDKLILIYRIALLVIIIVGIILNFKARDKAWYLVLSYYTLQSNIIVALFLMLEIINTFKPIKIFKEERRYQFFKGMITLIILITGLIFAILLSSYVKSWHGIRLASSYILHYICPSMVLIDFLFFDDLTTKLSSKMNILWFIYPLSYYIFGVLRVLYLDGFTPYPFMAVQMLGPLKSIATLAWLVGIFYLLSLILILAKNKISKKSITASNN